MSELESKLSWTFFQEISPTEELLTLLLPDETVKTAYKTVRDVAAFTNKRLIVIDAQGITGRKKEIYSLPYRSINMWSTENAGTLDLNAEVELWTRAGHIKIGLRRDIEVRQFEQLLAEACL
ncbi:MAG: PH domain-containing protein [Aerococcus sp.]|nr:PH domain-containing protein [Aerococcus sp.]